MGFHEEYLEITDRLKELQGKQAQIKIDLQIAYDYKEQVVANMKLADKQIKDRQEDYFKLLNSIQTEIARLKIAMDLEVGRLNVL
jgi:hypothetical protein